MTGDTLHVYVRGVPPRYPSGQRIDEQRISETVDHASGVARVIFHGAQRDITVDLAGGGHPGGGNPGGGSPGNPRQIAFLANRLLNDYSRELNIRTTRGQIVFDTQRPLRDREVEMLFTFNSLKATADLYSSLASNITDPETLKGAADSLLRHARLVNRLLRREGGSSLSNIVSTDWDQLRSELSRITLTDVNLDNDPDRNR